MTRRHVVGLIYSFRWHDTIPSSLLQLISGQICGWICKGSKGISVEHLTERVRDLGGKRQVSPAVGHHEARVDNEEEEGEDPEEDLHNILRWGRFETGEGLRIEGR